MDLDVLAWWKACDHSNLTDPASGTPAGLPTLAKMARQYLGCPASSAGVERMFSRAQERCTMTSRLLSQTPHWSIASWQQPTRFEF
mmetsp:Transcript_14069/g.42928  ORF Transcript_14069/g.42928 Transcript_14069/m.42928 type:complete len:86 (-) Transcript_14069:101-358(-)